MLLFSLQEIVPDWQNLSSRILVSLGRKHHTEVMEQLLMKFQPGILPHFFVVQTMADLASANGIYNFFFFVTILHKFTVEIY